MKYCKKCGAMLSVEHNFCSKCGAPVQSLEQEIKYEKPSADEQQGAVRVNLKKPSDGVASDVGAHVVNLNKSETGGASAKGRIDLSKTAADSDASANLAGMVTDADTRVKYEPSRDHSSRIKKILIGVAACIAVIAGMSAVYQMVGDKDNSADSMQQYAEGVEDTFQSEDAVEREQRLLEEQRRQEELLEEQRRRQEEENKVYVSEYEVVVADVTWKKAKKQAEERGGHLAVITSQEEQMEIEALVDRYDYLHTIWLGGKYKNGKFRWVNQEDFDYTNWGPGEPNNETGDEYFLDMYEVDDIWYWNDAPNDIKQYYSGKMGYVIEWEIEQ